MGEEDDAQAIDPEAGRVAEHYAAYAADPRRAAAWAAENPGNAAIKREVADAIWELIAPPAAAGILDVGCGTGWWLEELAARTETPLAGIEIQPARVAAARRRCPRAEVREGDARRLPWPDATFGAVTMLLTLSSLSSVDDARLAMREARRVVQPGGSVVVWEPRWPAPRGGRLTISARLLRDELAPLRADRTITLVPGLARRLGPAAPRWYPRLVRVPTLRSHRLMATGQT